MIGFYHNPVCISGFLSAIPFVCSAFDFNSTRILGIYLQSILFFGVYLQSLLFVFFQVAIPVEYLASNGLVLPFADGVYEWSALKLMLHILSHGNTHY